MSRKRAFAAIRVAGLHLSISLAIVAILAILIFRVWYPHPLSLLLGTKEMFLILLCVDIVCGPFLTLIFFNPDKSRRARYIDIATVVSIQLIAVLYGMSVVFNARPVFVALEGDMFRVVQAQDVFLANPENNHQKNKLVGFFGPVYIGTRLLDSNDPEYLVSIRLALEGVHPSFRPERWEALDNQKDHLLSVLKPISSLVKINVEQRGLLEESIRASGLTSKQLGYLPLVAKDQTNWIQLVRKDTGKPISILNIDGWASP
jgi:hypothetical protein